MRIKYFFAFIVITNLLFSQEKKEESGKIYLSIIKIKKDEMSKKSPPGILAFLDKTDGEDKFYYSSEKGWEEIYINKDFMGSIGYVKYIEISRLTKQQMNSYTSTPGEFVYNVEDKKYYYKNGDKWEFKEIYESLTIDIAELLKIQVRKVKVEDLEISVEEDEGIVEDRYGDILDVLDKQKDTSGSKKVVIEYKTNTYPTKKLDKFFTFNFFGGVSDFSGGGSANSTSVVSKSFSFGYYNKLTDNLAIEGSIGYNKFGAEYHKIDDNTQETELESKTDLDYLLLKANIVIFYDNLLANSNKLSIFGSIGTYYGYLVHGTLYLEPTAPTDVKKESLYGNSDFGINFEAGSSWQASDHYNIRLSFNYMLGVLDINNANNLKTTNNFIGFKLGLMMGLF